MTDLKKPSAETITLMTEYHRQCISGEYSAGYWQWEYESADGLQYTQYPGFFEDRKYSYRPAQAHPHYAIYKEWEGHKASGAVGLGHYSMCVRQPSAEHYTLNPSWDAGLSYEIRKTDKHPDNKPALKQLDWSKVPVGTLTNYGVVLFAGYTFINTLNNSEVTLIGACNFNRIRILPTKKWTALQDNQEPPECEGLVIEYRLWSHHVDIFVPTQNPDGNGINAYRVIGLADGYTDGGVV